MHVEPVRQRLLPDGECCLYRPTATGIVELDLARRDAVERDNLSAGPRTVRGRSFPMRTVVGKTGCRADRLLISKAIVDAVESIR